MKIGGYDIHPAAQLFPMMPETELQELAADIKAHGLIHPIILCDKKILDGRNRLLGCEIAGIGPYFRNHSGQHSPTEYVLATNLHRRQLTASQRATIAVEALPLLKEEARIRMLAGKTPSLKIGEGGKAASKAASAVGVSRAYVEQAQHIKEVAPKVFQQVANGEKTLSAAKKELGWEKPHREPSNLDDLKAAWLKCTKKEKADFLKWKRSHK